MPPHPTDDRTDDVTTRLREHLRAALESAELPATRRHLREALQLVDAVAIDTEADEA